MNEINRNDVIIGLIADDRMNEIYPKFFMNAITDKCLSECLKCVNYGNQYVFKTQKGCNAITIINQTNIIDCNIQKLKKQKKNLLGHINQQVQEIQEKYLGNGRYFSQILKEFR